MEQKVVGSVKATDCDVSYILKIFELNQAERSITLKEGEQIIGRGKLCHIAIVTDNKVSRQHCLISVSDQNILISDMSSHHGTFVNGKRVDRPDVKLNPGDRISLGTTLIILLPKE